MERSHILTPWSVALFTSCVVHAGLWFTLKLPETDATFINQLHALEVSLLPASPLQKKIIQPQKKSRVQAAAKPVSVTPIQNALAATEPEPVAEQTPAVADSRITDTTTNELQVPRFNAAYLNNPPPAYPLAARRRNIEGKVLVRAEVQTDGSCSQVELKIPSTSELLNQAALEAVKKWRFVPATLGGQTLVAWVEIPITFKLSN
jgi:protein TonB